MVRSRKIVRTASSGGAVTRGAIAAQLRGQITAGHFAPGSRLQTRTQLEQESGASPVTVQHALDLLRREGFVVVNGNQGTYVAPHPPHLFHYAMVFNRSRAEATTSRFFSALDVEASRYDGSEREPRRISVHYGVDAHVDNREMRTLLAAMRNGALAGLVFPEYLPGTPLWGTSLAAEPGVPRVALIPAPLPGLASLSLHTASFYSQALDRLRASGRRRIAVIANNDLPEFREPILAALRERGMETRPHWFLGVSLADPHFARGVARCLLHAGQRERPDGLLITDDNLVEPVKGGVLDAGMRVPDELEIVEHCNFPWNVSSAMPVTRVGYDCREVLASCLDLLVEQRQGLPPRMAEVKAVLESAT